MTREEFKSQNGIIGKSKEINDLVDRNVKEFYNLLDKGYRVIQTILRFNQKAVQPIFASVMRSFNALEDLCISEIASDRSGNERGVKCVKYSVFISNSLKIIKATKRRTTFGKRFRFNAISCSYQCFKK